MLARLACWDTPIIGLLLGLVMLALTGCASLGGSTTKETLEAVPDQEAATVEAKAVMAQRKVAEALVAAMASGALTTTVEVPRGNDANGKPLSPAVVRIVDSGAFQMLARVGDFSQYKSAPGFWTWATAFTTSVVGPGVQAAIPWLGAAQMISNAAGNSATYNNSFNASGTQSTVGYTPGNGSIMAAQPTTTTTTTTTDRHDTTTTTTGAEE